MMGLLATEKGSPFGAIVAVAMGVVDPFLSLSSDGLFRLPRGIIA